MFCKNCGNEIKPGKDICDKCGRQQHIYDVREYYGREKRNSKSAMPYIIAAATAIVLLLIAGIFYMYVSYVPPENALYVLTPTDAELAETPEVTANNTLTVQEYDLSGVYGSTPTDAAGAIYSNIDELITHDVSGAEALKTAIENVLHFSTEEKAAYLMSHENQVIRFSFALLLDDPEGVYADIFGIMGGSVPDVRYTVNGATGYSFMVDSAGTVYIWINTADNDTAWQICPVLSPEYNLK